MKHLFKYEVKRPNGHIFYCIFKLEQIEKGVAENWLNVNKIGGKDILNRLPYVTDDKNGERVFAGDKIHIWCNFLKIDVPEAEVFWNEKLLRFDIKVRTGKYRNCLQNLHQCHWQCELLKDGEK